jgi:hypothetical protein
MKKKYLKFPWFNNPVEQEQKESFFSKDSNIIIFEINETDDVTIKMFFNCDIDKASESMGQFLNQLTTGQLNDTVLKTMISLGEDYPDFRAFVKHSIECWLHELKSNNEKETTKIIEESPLIKPSYFSAHK